MADITYQKNPDLQFVIKDERCKGNLKVNGRFVDPYRKMNVSFRTFLRWRSQKNPWKEEKENENYSGKWTDCTAFIHDRRDGLVWLGHATFLFRLHGELWITDPLLFSLPLMKRYTPLPLPFRELIHIRHVLLSHAHRDHCDEKSLRSLSSNNSFRMYVPLNVGKVIRPFLPHHPITEFGWYQTLTAPSGVRITFLPAQHWSNRFPWDNNQTLWGSFMIESDAARIYFGGDSGYTQHYADIRAVFPPPHLALLGIGAYDPPFMMQYSHMNPEEAFQACAVLQAEKLFPMHYSVLDLSDEPMGQPLQRIQHVFREKNKESQLLDLHPGQVYYF
jgi:L-ascorbate metabolism protein UlaG (beta-lactamase superfamily)